MNVDAVINELCNKFNITINELIPKIVAYKKTMLLLEIIVTIFFIILLLFIVPILLKNHRYIKDILWFSRGCSSIPITILILALYEYIGWQYAPDVKAIEYIMGLF